MNFVDVIFFQAEIAPDKLALIGHGSVISYGRFARGILSAQQRLTAIGLTAGQTVGLHVAHPIDHLVLACALYRMKVASATITNTTIDTYLELVSFDAILADIVLPTVSKKQPKSRMVLVDPTWFQDKIEFNVTQRTSSRRDPAPYWISRLTCFSDNGAVPVVKTTSQQLEAQLQTYCLSAPPRWDRMITLAGLISGTGFIQALSALWLGRTVCFSDTQTVRGLISIYRHDYLVAPISELEPLLRAQENQFVSLQALRAVCFEGPAFGATAINRALTTISSNLLLRYSHPEVGIVAYGDAARIKEVDGAVGFVAPWIEAEVVDTNRTALAVGKEGALRFRTLESEATTKSAQPRGTTDGWIYPQQRAKLLSNNLLVVSGKS
jgi:non-ribosomal peptide synthetase component E (peptide arylation enzyme)